jgi:hypothetical protein
MSDLITSQMLSDWRANYGLDKRTPIKAMHWWQDNMDGKAPAGVVAALGLCINEIERLTAERDELRRQLAEAELDAQRYRWLRNEANTARKCDPMVCIYPLDEQDLIDGDRLDIAIDAVMGGGDA